MYRQLTYVNTCLKPLTFAFLDVRRVFLVDVAFRSRCLSRRDDKNRRKPSSLRCINRVMESEDEQSSLSSSSFRLGLSEFDLMKSSTDESNLAPYETSVNLVTKHGILKEFLTRYETDRLKIYSSAAHADKQRYLFEIDLNNVLAICNQSSQSISLKSRATNLPTISSNSQCVLIVDEQNSFNEFVWIFPNELERALWTRELLKRQYTYHQLIYSDFILLTKLNVQEGINAEKQQVIALVYAGRFVICSDTIFDEVDLRKYSSLSK